MSVGRLQQTNLGLLCREILLTLVNLVLEARFQRFLRLHVSLHFLHLHLFLCQLSLEVAQLVVEHGDLSRHSLVFALLHLICAVELALSLFEPPHDLGMHLVLLVRQLALIAELLTGLLDGILRLHQLLVRMIDVSLPVGEEPVVTQFVVTRIADREKLRILSGQAPFVLPARLADGLATVVAVVRLTHLRDAILAQVAVVAVHLTDGVFVPERIQVVEVVIFDEDVQHVFAVESV